MVERTRPVTNHGWMLQVTGPYNPFSVLLVVEGDTQKDKSIIEIIKTEF